MPDCLLLDTCPFFNDNLYEMAEDYKEKHCKGDFQWCGRHMVYIAVERERSLRFGNYTAMEAENG